MSEWSILCSFENRTKMILSNSITNGYGIWINSYCTIKDLCLKEETSLKIFETVDICHGIMYTSTFYLDNDLGGKYMSINNIYIEYFSVGAITCNNTDYSISSSIDVSDVVIKIWNVEINF